MYRMVDKLIHQYGTELMLCRHGEETAARGFFRAVTSHSQQSMEPGATPLGERSREQYTYIGPAGLPVAENDTVSVKGKAYRFCRVEPYIYNGHVLYFWGLCAEKEEETPWGAQS